MYSSFLILNINFLEKGNFDHIFYQIINGTGIVRYTKR